MAKKQNYRFAGIPPFRLGVYLATAILALPFVFIAGQLSQHMTSEAATMPIVSTAIRPNLTAIPAVATPGEAVYVIIGDHYTADGTVSLYQKEGTTPVATKMLTECQRSFGTGSNFLYCSFSLPATKGYYNFRMTSHNQVIAYSNPIANGVVVPTPSVQPEPSHIPYPSINPSISPRLSCMPKPACLNSTPRCMIAEPAVGWCPIPSAGPVTTNK